jgi:tRNA A37 threonylcarbamoyladenosine dehydratase
MYLAAAGVGTIGIADADSVDLSNLQRQIIHDTGEVGKPKVVSARETMNAMNPDVEVVSYHEWVNSTNIADIPPHLQRPGRGFPQGKTRPQPQMPGLRQRALDYHPY